MKRKEKKMEFKLNGVMTKIKGGIEKTKPKSKSITKIEPKQKTTKNREDPKNGLKIDSAFTSPFQHITCNLGLITEDNIWYKIVKWFLEFDGYDKIEYGIENMKCHMTFYKRDKLANKEINRDISKDEWLKISENHPYYKRDWQFKMYCGENDSEPVIVFESEKQQ